MLIKLSEYKDDNSAGTPVYINSDEVAAIREYRYHSFRPAIGEVVLQSGEKVRVWETVDQIARRIYA